MDSIRFFFIKISYMSTELTLYECGVINGFFFQRKRDQMKFNNLLAGIINTNILCLND